MTLLKAIFPVLILCSTLFAADPIRCPARVTRMKLERGAYSPQPGATYELQNFEADMVARGKTSPLCFLRTTQILGGVVFVSSESLTHMFQQKIAQSKSQLGDVKVETREDNTVRISGKMKKKITMAFEIEGPVTTDGKNLIVQAKKIKTGKLPIKWLLGMLGKDLGEMIGAESVSGVVAKENTLIFQPAEIAHVEGHIAKLRTTEKGMMITFGEEPQKRVVSRSD